MALISNGTTIASGGSLSVSASPPSTAGAVGSYAYVYFTSGSVSPGGTFSGGNSNVRWGGFENTNLSSGTWRGMGKADASQSLERRYTIAIRIS